MTGSINAEPDKGVPLLVAREGSSNVFLDSKGRRYADAEILAQTMDAFSKIRPADTVRIPLPGQPVEFVEIRYPSPLSDSDWDYLMNVLAVMKPGISGDRLPVPVGGTE